MTLYDTWFQVFARAMDWPILFIVGLAAWRLAHMLMVERGPFDIFTRLRELYGVKHDANEDRMPYAWPENSIFLCIYCMSIWTGLVFAVLPWWLSIPFAVSGIAILFDAVNGRLGR